MCGQLSPRLRCTLPYAVPFRNVYSIIRDATRRSDNNAVALKVEHLQSGGLLTDFRPKRTRPLGSTTQTILQTLRRNL